MAGWLLVILEGSEHNLSADYEIKTTLDAELNAIALGNITVGTNAIGTVRVYNAGDAAGTFLRFTASCSNRYYAGQTIAEGQECVTEQWVQARVGLGAWTAIGGDGATPGNYLALVPLAAGASVDVELQLVVPVGASTAGQWFVVPEVFFDGS